MSSAPWRPFDLEREHAAHGKVRQRVLVGDPRRAVLLAQLGGRDPPLESVWVLRDPALCRLVRRGVFDMDHTIHVRHIVDR